MQPPRTGPECPRCPPRCPPSNHLQLPDRRRCAAVEAQNPWFQPPQLRGQYRQAGSRHRSATPSPTYLEPIEPHTRDGSWWFAWVVFAAFAFAVWLTRWPLNGWAGDFGLYFIHPIIWLTVGLLAGYGWLRLENASAFKPTLIGIAFWTGVLHVIMLIIAGIISSFVDSPFVDGVIEYPLNLFYVITVLAAAETSRAFLFTVWRRDDRTTAFVVISLMFAIAALTAAELTPFDSVDELLEVAGQRWLPVLAISLLATALVDIGGPGPSCAYRLAVLGFMWVWPSLPDLHWILAAFIGIAMPWFAWRLINAVYLRTKEGENTLKGTKRALDRPQRDRRTDHHDGGDPRRAAPHLWDRDHGVPGPTDRRCRDGARVRERGRGADRRGGQPRVARRRRRDPDHGR